MSGGVQSPHGWADSGTRQTAEEFRAEIEAELSTSLDADHRAYRCPNCKAGCINPADSLLYRARVCLDCYVSYLVGE